MKASLRRLGSLVTATVPEVRGVARLLGELLDRERGDTLRANRAFRELVERMPHFFFVTRPDGYHEYFNRPAFEYTGLNLDGLRGAGALELVHPDEPPVAPMRLGLSVPYGLPNGTEDRLYAA